MVYAGVERIMAMAFIVVMVAVVVVVVSVVLFVVAVVSIMSIFVLVVVVVEVVIAVDDGGEGRKVGRPAKRREDSVRFGHWPKVEK